MTSKNAEDRTAPGDGRPKSMADVNDTAMSFPGKNRLLHQLIEEQAAKTPGAPAVAFEGRGLTYDELNRRGDRLAHRLRTLGAGPDSLVGLFLERSLDTVVGILGILKAGAGYVPMDPANPPERIAYVIKDANLRVLVTHAGLLKTHPVAAAQVVLLDAFDWNAATGPTLPAADVRPEHAAYVIYTSGSTGRPKGVCVEHRNIVNYVLGVTERLKLPPGLRYATVSTIAADLGNTVVFPALVTGGCLHVLSQERTENQAMLAEYFLREGIDVLKIVPSHLAALQTGKNPEQVMPRRRLILGGEASRLDWIERLRAMAPDCEIFNHYGPTETTVGVLTYAVGPQLPRTLTGTLPLGKPLPNSRVYVLDGQGQPAPIGDQGEVFIGGDGVARGYLDRADLTAEKFVPDTLSPAPHGRLYRTGDLGRYLPDGNIEFCGRVDHQVKIHGNRIELGEIEGVLRQQAGVREAVVLAPEDEAGLKELVAYLTPKRADQPLWHNKAHYVLPDGSPVAHLNKNETDYIYNEIFVLQAYLRHGITVRDGDCILDAGANIGLFTNFMGRLARNLRIFSFEPNPAAFACLKINAAATGAEATCLPVGLSRENKTADLTFFEGLSLLSGFYADAATERQVVKTFVLNQQPESSNDDRLASQIGDMIDDRMRAKTVTAQLRTLSGVILEQGIDRIDLLKINVEKSELDVLQGLGPADWPKIRQAVIEVDEKKNLQPVMKLLEQNGFEVLMEQDPLLKKTDLCYVYAIRPSPSGPRLLREQGPSAHVRPLPPWNGEILAPASLRHFLRERLPQYMIPSAFVLMEKFPLTPNGKIDRQSFPAVVHEKARPSKAAARPQTETEKTLAGIWAELLKLESVGLADDFFDLGGQSLLAIRSISRIRDAFEVDLQLRNLFERPTVAGLAEVIDGLRILAKPKAPVDAKGDREELEL